MSIDKVIRVIANAKIASPKDMTCSGFTFGVKASVDIIYTERRSSNCHNKNKIPRNQSINKTIDPSKRMNLCSIFAMICFGLVSLMNNIIMEEYCKL
jgi:hypothetical protein